MIQISHRITGDVEVQRQLMTAKSKVRDAVTAAIFGLAREAEDMARSKAAGLGSHIAAGITLFMQGEPFPTRKKSGLSNEEYRAAREALDDKSRVAAVVASTFYKGRFYEEGFPRKKILVGTGLSTVAFNAYKKSYEQSARWSMKKHGTGPLSKESHDRAVQKANKSVMRALKRARSLRGATGQYEREHEVKRHQFMAPTIEAIARKFPSAIQAAVDKAISG